MAIIACPSCKKRISSKYQVCPYCKSAISSDGVAAGSYETSPKEALRKHRYRVEMLSYLSVLITVAGVAWIWADSGGLEYSPGPWSVSTLVVGAGMYLVVRVYIICYNILRNRK